MHQFSLFSRSPLFILLKFYGNHGFPSPNSDRDLVNEPNISHTDEKFVNPIHFIDAEGMKPEGALDIRGIVQDRLAAWVYHDLTLTKVRFLMCIHLCHVLRSASKAGLCILSPPS